MIGLGILLAVHMYRGREKAYSSSLFSQFVRWAVQLRKAVESGSFQRNVNTPSSEPQPCAPVEQRRILFPISTSFMPG